MDTELSQHNQKLMNNRRELLQRDILNQQDVKELNKDILKNLRKYLSN